jgi:carbamoyl-phosphate synthase large subunit
LSVFAKNKEILEKNGIKLAIPDYKTLTITEDKVKTNKCFEEWKIPCPKSYEKKDLKRGRVKFPLIMKPIKASGSKGIVKINNWKELDFFRNYYRQNVFIQEYVTGEEYTIDGVCDLTGKMIAASPRIRLEVKGGLATKAITKNNPLLVNFTREIVENFGVIGPFNVQCFKKGKDVKFIEINSRFPSGGLPLTVKSGLNIPMILIKLLLGKKIDKPEIKAGLTMTRYWEAIVLRKDGGEYRAM